MIYMCRNWRHERIKKPEQSKWFILSKPMGLQHYWASRAYSSPASHRQHTFISARLLSTARSDYGVCGSPPPSISLTGSKADFPGFDFFKFYETGLQRLWSFFDACWDRRPKSSPALSESVCSKTLQYQTHALQSVQPRPIGSFVIVTYAYRSKEYHHIDQKDASWRQMFITQPPSKRSSLYTSSLGRGRFWRTTPSG